MTVVELRQYTMHAGRRQDFAEQFDRHFVTGQQDCGFEVIGQFLDVRRPDRYVWMRRFADMEARRAGLERFYTGPVWRREKDAANATMIDWHDVLLLRPAWPGADVDLTQARAGPSGRLRIAAWAVAPAALQAHAASFRAAHAAPLAAYVTEPSTNTYPRLPIRDDASVFVAVLRGDAPLPDDRGAPVVDLLLQPTAGSALR